MRGPSDSPYVSSPAARAPLPSASVSDLRAEQNMALRMHDSRINHPVAPRAAAAAAMAPSRPAARVAPAPARSAAPVAQPPAPAHTASPAAPVAATPAVSTSTTTAAAPTSEAAPAAAYKPVEDLGAARRAAFMGEADTAMGMKKVRELLANEAGINPADVNKYKVSQLESMALAKRGGNGGNWSASIDPEKTKAALSGGTPLNTAAFTDPRASEAVAKAGITYEPSSLPQDAWAKATEPIPDKSFGMDFAVQPWGAPLTRDVGGPAAQPTTPSPGSVDNYMRAQTRDVLQKAVQEGRYREPVDLTPQTTTFGKVGEVSASAMIEAFHNAGEPAPLDAATASMMPMATDVLGTRKPRMASGSLGYRDTSKMAPLVANAWSPAIAGLPR